MKCEICGNRPNLHNRLCVLKGLPPLDEEVLQ
jgi:hypothetical protein